MDAVDTVPRFIAGAISGALTGFFAFGNNTPFPFIFLSFNSMIFVGVLTSYFYRLCLVVRFAICFLFLQKVTTVF